MSDLLSRISETAQRAHDTNLELLELADELREFASRACGETSRLQRTLKGGLDGALPNGTVMRLPRGIQPEKQEASA